MFALAGQIAAGGAGALLALSGFGLPLSELPALIDTALIDTAEP